MMRMTFWSLAWCVWCGVSISRADAPVSVYWADRPIVIDGLGDDPAWEHAQIIDRFTLPWLGADSREAATSTRARLLWDRHYLYFLAEMEDHDLFADVIEHDGPTWHNDVFELFFRPDPNKPGYYEFQVNALNARFDAFFPSRNREEFGVAVGKHLFRFESAVTLRGTLNERDDRDIGWMVEGRIPWTDFLSTGGRPVPGEVWRFALCRYDYSAGSDEPELSTSAPLRSSPIPDFHLIDDYAPLAFVGPADSPRVDPVGVPESVPLTTSRVHGSPDPPLPFKAVRVAEELRPAWPIDVIAEPGSRRLIFIDVEPHYTRSRLWRTSGFPETGELETLLELTDVAYCLEFHPRFSENGYLYVGSNGSSSDGVPKQSRVTRYTISREPPYALDPDSALVIIEWESDGHNGAAITFGHDGMLYVTTGDGTSDSDTDLAGQRLDHLLAKVLRIDVDRPDPGRNYSVPEDNPFVHEPGIRPETWAYGLRNPWRITTDPATGRIWLAQNGQDLWEQVYVVTKGANFGWSVYEGSHLFYPSRELGPHEVVWPTFEHPHSEARSLTGGVVYHGSRYPELRGAYIYGDFSTGKIWGGLLDADGELVWHRELADTPFAITAIRLDPDGELIIADHQGGNAGGFYGLVPNDPEDSQAVAFPRRLSESGLFALVPEHLPVPGAIPYGVNSPLWSDGTHKERFVALPADPETGAIPTIAFHPRDSWGFPNETVLVKSFALEQVEGDPATRRWIETRFLHRRQNEWYGYSYRWYEDQSDAELVPTEGLDATFSVETDQGIRKHLWRYPSRAECMVCHSRAANFVLGLSTPQLNGVHDYQGTPDNPLRVFEHLGVLDLDWQGEAVDHLRKELEAAGHPPEVIQRVVSQSTPDSDQRQPRRTSLLPRNPEDYAALPDPYDETLDLAARARSYLHANCAHCHVMAGGGNSQIDLAWWTSLEGTRMIDVPPVHHRFDLEDARLIAPGHPERSVLLHRMAIRDRGQMPQLATSLPDEQAIHLLTRWIATLEPHRQNDTDP